MPKTKIGSLRPPNWALALWRGPAGRSDYECVWFELCPPEGEAIVLGYVYDQTFRLNMEQLLDSESRFVSPIDLYGGSYYATVGLVDSREVEVQASLDGTSPGVVFGADDFWHAFEYA